MHETEGRGRPEPIGRRLTLVHRSDRLLLVTILFSEAKASDFCHFGEQRSETQRI